MEERLAYIQDVASSNLARPIKEENIMEKLIKKLDEIFAKYNVEQGDVEEVGILISNLGGAEIVAEGEEFVAPEMGEGNEEDEEYGD